VQGRPWGRGGSPGVMRRGLRARTPQAPLLRSCLGTRAHPWSTRAHPWQTRGPQGHRGRVRRRGLFQTLGGSSSQVGGESGAASCRCCWRWRGCAGVLGESVPGALGGEGQKGSGPQGGAAVAAAAAGGAEGGGEREAPSEAMDIEVEGGGKEGVKEEGLGVRDEREVSQQKQGAEGAEEGQQGAAQEQPEGGAGAGSETAAPLSNRGATEPQASPASPPAPAPVGPGVCGPHGTQLAGPGCAGSSAPGGTRGSGGRGPGTAATGEESDWGATGSHRC